jgi:hypothetical protein
VVNCNNLKACVTLRTRQTLYNIPFQSVTLCFNKPFLRLSTAFRRFSAAATHSLNSIEFNLLFTSEVKPSTGHYRHRVRSFASATPQPHMIFVTSISSIHSDHGPTEALGFAHVLNFCHRMNQQLLAASSRRDPKVSALIMGAGGEMQSSKLA